MFQTVFSPELWVCALLEPQNRRRPPSLTRTCAGSAWTTLWTVCCWSADTWSPAAAAASAWASVPSAGSTSSGWSTCSGPEHVERTPVQTSPWNTTVNGDQLLRDVVYVLFISFFGAFLGQANFPLQSDTILLLFLFKWLLFLFYFPIFHLWFYYP